MELYVKRTTSTSPIFVSPKKLPSPLRKAVLGYLQALRRGENKQYGFIDIDTQEGAEDMCLDVSEDFLQTLDGVGISGGALREYIFFPMSKEEAFLQRFDDFLDSFPFDSSRCRFHFAVKVGEFIIDWTARQFGANNPFPAIWREI